MINSYADIAFKAAHCVWLAGFWHVPDSVPAWYLSPINIKNNNSNDNYISNNINAQQSSVF